jgi:4-amino-4-deoxy-L-arabinose transferase-like glycosyltransferase
MSATIALPPQDKRIVPYRWITVVFLALFTVFRFWYSGHVELDADEAYYWQWSRHLAGGYYDNTPLVAFIIHFATSPSLFGPTVVGVRAGAVCSSVIVSVFLYLLGRKLLDERTALTAVVVANVIPLYSAGAILMTQDPVHVALWSATLFVAWIALGQVGTLPTWGWWLLAGVLAGLTTMAKLNGCMILVGILLYVVMTPDARRWLKHPAPYVAVAIALIIFLPFLIWNHSHENAFWLHSHSMASRGTDKAKTLRWTGEFLGAQAILLSPLIFLTYLYTLRRPKLADEPDKSGRPLLYLWCASAVVFTVIILQTFRGRVEGNWAVSSYVSGIVLVAWLMSRSNSARIWHYVSIAIAVLMTAIVYFPSIAYSMGLRLKTDRTTDLHGWQVFAKRVYAEQQELGGPAKSFVFSVNYRLPSELAFYLPGQPETYSLFLHDRRNEYMFWDNPNKRVGQNAIFVNDSNGPDHLDDCRAIFKHVDLEPPFKYYQKPYKSPVRIIQIFRCYGFKGYNPAQWEKGW